MAKKVSIEITLDKQTKDELVEAAEVCGMDLSTFMTAATQTYVERAQRHGQSICVSDEDRDKLRSALQISPRDIS